MQADFIFIKCIKGTNPCPSLSKIQNLQTNFDKTKGVDATTTKFSPLEQFWFRINNRASSTQMSYSTNLTIPTSTVLLSEQIECKHDCTAANAYL